MFKKLVLEGTDGIGKTTFANILGWIGFEVFDRDKNVSQHVQLDNVDIEKVANYIQNNKDKLFVFVIYKDEEVKEQIQKFLDRRKDKDQYDKYFDKYNKQYVKLAEKLQHLDNVLVIERKGRYTLFEVIRDIILGAVKDYPLTDDNITLEGESKIYRRIPGLKLAFATLKPTVYSFTFKRYGVVKGTDVVRNKIWEIIGTHLNRLYSAFKFSDYNFIIRNLNYYAAKIQSFKNDNDIFITNYIARINDNTSLVLFEDEIPPIEVVYKEYWVGTFKHRLKYPERYKTRSGKIIKVGDKLPYPVIRFDWRNPIERDPQTGEMRDWGDECIPDDLADLYIDVRNAKTTVKFVSFILKHMFWGIGLELVDLCYFMNYNGDRIHSEITPDGMRLKLLNDRSDYDKDLWRKGLPKDVLVKRWTQVLEKLESEYSK